jgi:hypothetical protein
MGHGYSLSLSLGRPRRVIGVDLLNGRDTSISKVNFLTTPTKPVLFSIL